MLPIADVPRLQRSTSNSFDLSRPYGRAYALPAFQAWTATSLDFHGKPFA